MRPAVEYRVSVYNDADELLARYNIFGPRGLNRRVEKAVVDFVEEHIYQSKPHRQFTVRVHARELDGKYVLA